ncbi:MAG: hypothetical protein Q4C52_09780 [Eubacteriales bacterium]|nr:hypothetical protein [Eubacteriales bacterium]
MKERQEDLRGRLREHRRVTVWLLILILLGVAAVVIMCFTKDETEPISLENVQEEQGEIRTDEETGGKALQENEGCLYMDTNPLNEVSDKGIRQAVEDYYDTLAEHADFVESYNNLQIFAKLGKYKGTYIAFVRYDMKIRDIYTEVPGLGTLYVQEDQNGVYQVVAKTGDQEIQEYVNHIVAHGDVQALMSQIQTDYANAVASDAMLAEALEDLKNAYENRTER